MSAEKKRDELDEADARAFNPRAKSIAHYFELEEKGLIKPPVFHYRLRNGKMACGTTEAVFERTSAFAVTCPECRVVCAADEAKAMAKREARRKGTSRG